MSHLTPPRSQQNTPQRPQDEMSRASGSAPAASAGQQSWQAVTTEEVDVDDSGESMGGLDVEDEDEAPIDLSDDEMMEVASPSEHERMDEDEELIEEIRPVSPTGDITAAEKGKGKRTIPAKRRSRGKGKAAAMKQGAKKDNDLYESEIVARWNAEIGDVCAKPPKPQATKAL